MKKNDEGFTLIELLIVIVILGILATVVVFSVRGITDQGKESSCKTDGRTLETAIEAYYAKYGSSATPTEDSLESAGLIRDASANYNIDAATGNVSLETAANGGKCNP